MKSPRLKFIEAWALLAAIAIPVSVAAQERRHYKLIDLGTFGGSASYVNPVGNGGPYMNREEK
jgi:hypothetical protein